MQKKFEEEGHAKAVAQDNLIACDRKANANQNALEEVRTLLEQADRNRKYTQLFSLDNKNKLVFQVALWRLSLPIQMNASATRLARTRPSRHITQYGPCIYETTNT